MPRKQTKTKRKSLAKTRAANRGARGEILPGDGKIFSNITSIPRTVMIGPSTYNIVSSFSVKSWHTGSITVPTFNAVSIVLSQFNDSASFTSIFDQYMISEAEVWILPEGNIASSPGLGGRVMTVIDVDDDNNLSSMAQADDYTSSVLCETSQGFYRHFVPHVAIAAYSGAFTSFANAAHQWIDAASPAVKHYGVKLAMDPGFSVAQVYDLKVRAHIKFRSVR